MSETNSSSTRVRIYDLTKSTNIEDSDLFIMEDEEDTKQATFALLKQYLNGDYSSPSSGTFYSSQKIEKEIEALLRNISNKTDFQTTLELINRVNSIVANSSSSDGNVELIDARGGYRTLRERLEEDLRVNDSKYMKKFSRTVLGTNLYIEGNGEIDITIKDRVSTVNNSADRLYIHSLNMLNFRTCSGSSVSVDNNTNGFTITRNALYPTQTIDIPLDFVYPSGDYFFSAETVLSAEFIDTVTFVVVYTDGQTEEFPYSHSSKLSFKAKKSISSLKIKYVGNKNFTDTVQYRNVMLTKDCTYSSYINYYFESKVLSIGSSVKAYRNNNYIYYYPNSKGELSITYRDDSIDISYLYDKLIEAHAKLDNKNDKCGLIEKEGVIQSFEDAVVTSDADGECTFIKDMDMSRNNIPSLKMTVNEDATSNIVFKQPLFDIPAIENVTLSFYIDSNVTSYLGDNNGISIMLCSDNPDADDIVNYYQFNIKKNMLVQGWNNIKKTLSEFNIVGSPDLFNIRFIAIEVYRNSGLNGKSIWFNSIIFNQRMKPTLLLSFDGVYDESVSYIFPTLNAKKIPATVFLNNRSTLTGDVLNRLLMQKIEYGWDIGCYGCNPNKECLIQDDNYYIQYTSLANSKQYLHDSLINSPVSYSAPYGNLRKITVPILKDLGYGIAKVKADSYCSVFTRKDFAVPRLDINNQTKVQDIYDAIDYIINTGQTICLHTNNVTEFGDEASTTRSIFGSIINYIGERCDDGDLQCLSFEQFYHKCTD